MPSIVWKGNLTFGLVSIPVKLFRAARRERVQMHYVHEQPSAAAPPPETPVEEEEPEPEAVASTLPPAPPAATYERIRQALVSTADEQPVVRSEIQRGYEVEPDRYVVFDRSELKKLQRKTSATMEIVRSVQLSEIDPVFFETSYYLAPDRGGEKPYAILFAALKETGRVALARVGMHGREHVVVVRPGAHGMLAHTMFYVDEIRSESEYRADVQSVGAKELQLARIFLESVEGPFAPEEFKDEYREELQALIAKKAGGAGAAAPPPLAPAAKPAVDIIEALKKSIAMAKDQAARKMPGRVTGAENKPKTRTAR